MFKVPKVITAILVLMVVVSGFAFILPRVNAFEVRKEKNLDKNEVVNGDLFIGGETVKVAGTVKGNLFIAGASVEVSGKVEGNVFAAGSMVLITGDVGRTVMAAGGTVDVSGNVGRDVFIGAGQASVSGTVGENLYVGSGTLLVKGDVKENLYVGAGQVTVLGNVSKDAFVSTGSANIDKELVKGTLSLDIEDKAKQQERFKLDNETGRKLIAGLTAFAVFMKVMWFVGMYILGLIVLRFFPKFSAAVEKEITTAFAKNVGIGILVILAFPLAFLLLCVTLIGIPIAVAMGGILSAILFFASIFGGKALGQYLFKALKFQSNDAAELFVGQALLTLFWLIPFFGFFAALAVNAAVVGAVLSVPRA